MAGTKATKPQRTRAQHYVPQFYLRGFTNARGKLFCYDKATGRSFSTTTEDAAQERDFYEVSPAVFPSIPFNFMEKLLSDMESKWKPVHDELIRCADAGRISNELTIGYAPFLAIQWLRTKTNRDATSQIAQRSMQSIADELVEYNFPGEKKPKVTLGDDGIVALHVEELLDRPKIDRMAKDLERHIWVVGINRTEHLFYTSDHPVVRRANQMKAGRQLVGIRDPGIEFVFPLDSTHAILILERSYFADWRQHNNRSVLLTAKQVKDYNTLQVMRSGQRVFCANDE